MKNTQTKIFKALADDTRLEIVQFLAGQKESSCADLSQQFDLSQPTLSHHYNKLIDAGILKVRKDGVSHFYCIDQKFLKQNGINIKKLGENNL